MYRKVIFSTIGFVLFSFFSFADSQPPTTPSPADAVVTVSKNTGTNSVDFSWTASAAPYALIRSTNPNFNLTSPAPSPLAGGLTGTTTADWDSR
ncbi:MAG: hypothetical protein LC778_16875 [Acidobacteria bacterium]|nr:hypothetical protein [Acidobacteriota bacterium]